MKNCHISCNFTNELIELIEQKEVDVDYIRWPSFDPKYISIKEVAKYGKPILLHGFNGYLEHYISNDISECEIKIEKRNVKKLKKMSQKYNFPYYSAHIGGIISKMNKIKWNKIYCTSEEEKVLLQQTIDNIKRLKSILDKEIIIENIPIFKGISELEKFPECVGRPEFISEVIYKSDIDFLLDIAHARVTASALGIDIYKYLDELPLERVREIHISGVQETKMGQLADFHNNLDKIDIELLIYVMKKSKKLEFITYEFTPQDKDFYLLKENEKSEIKLYPTVKVKGVNLKAKANLKNDLDMLRKIVIQYNKKTSGMI